MIRRRNSKKWIRLSLAIVGILVIVLFGLTLLRRNILTNRLINTIHEHTAYSYMFTKDKLTFQDEHSNLAGNFSLFSSFNLSEQEVQILLKSSSWLTCNAQDDCKINSLEINSENVKCLEAVEKQHKLRYTLCVDSLLQEGRWIYQNY